jgi:hypothetical protein
MPRQQIDRDKLRVQLRRLPKDILLELIDRAIDLVPRTRLPALVEGYIDPDALLPDSRSAGRLLGAVRAFREASLRGDYYQDFAVDSKNFMDMSRGTETWIAECERLFNRCVAGAGRGRHTELRESFEILLELLRHIDEGNDDVVFFADEGGSWQVGVSWEDVLPAYFVCLSPTTEPEGYARMVNAVVDDFVRHDRDKYMRKARGIGTKEQKRLLR